MEVNTKDIEHKPFIQSGFFKSDKILSHENIKSMIESEIKSSNSDDLKRSDFMFPSAYSKVDISKIFMDVVI